MNNSFDTRSSLNVHGKSYEVFDVSRLAGSERLPYSFKILLENLLRHEDGITVTAKDIEAVLHWKAGSEPAN